MKWLAPAAVMVLAVGAELTVGRLTRAPDLALFLGRFHPLVVHLPIGFFLLVAMGEAVSFVPRLRERVEPALGLLLPLSAAAALAAFLMGQLLALEGGFPAASLSWHRRLTLIAVVGIAACWVVFERQRDHGSGRWAYRGVLAVTLGVLSLGAHFGGTMTRGDAYLSKYAPGPLKLLLGGPGVGGLEAKPAPKKPASAAAAEPLVYEHVVQPLFTTYCVECHGSEKQKGKLRLDSLAELMKGGENGAVLVAGDAAKSSIVARALLPISDDDHMPPEDKPQLAPAELAVIRFWIDRGATPTLRVKDALAPAASRSLLEHAASGATKSDQVPTIAAPSLSSSPAPTSPTAKAEAAPAPEPDPEPASARDAAPAPAPAPTSAAASAPMRAPSGSAFLATHCTKCHGPGKQKGKLRVDSFAALLKGGGKGPALVPGSPDKSSIVQRVRLPLASDDHMPPKKEPQPTAAEVAAFVAWVRSGAGGASPAEATLAPESSAVSASGSEPPLASSGEAVDEAVSHPAPTQPAAAAVDARRPDSARRESLPEHVALFADVIQPLFRDKCGKCHIRASPAAGLAMGEHEQLLEGGYSGPGIVPKNRAKSLVMARIVVPLSDDEHMPPEGEPQLNADEVELIGSWIDQGAPAAGPVATSALTARAARALGARGIKPASSPALAPKSGGCAACTIPGAIALDARFLQLQSAATFGLAALLLLRRRRRCH
jgi:uncharacterized membrane protein